MGIKFFPKILNTETGEREGGYNPDKENYKVDKDGRLMLDENKNPIKEEIPLYVKEYKMNPMTCSLEIKPEHNQLVIFPSWMYHFSNLNKEEDRRSLAFNLAPVGEIGDGDSTIFI